MMDFRPMAIITIQTMKLSTHLDFDLVEPSV